MTQSCLAVLVLATLAACSFCSPLPDATRPDVVLKRSRPLGLADAMPLRSMRPHKQAPGARTRAVESADSPYRLPTTTTATYYELELTPHLSGDFTFHGVASIYFNVLESTDKIVFHSKELSFSALDCTLFLEGEEGLELGPAVRAVEFDIVHEFATVTPATQLTEGLRYMLRISYDGKLNDELIGFYRSSYTVDGEKRWLAATQFEPTGARRAFPCWDEPSHKARFDITIHHGRDMTALSNMPAVDTSTPGTTTFDTTLPMSTYTLAFVVSDFKSLEDRANNFATWAREEVLSGGALSQEIGPQALKVIGQMTGVEYLLPKMDQAAIPDFSAAGMENWGLVLYREGALMTRANTMTLGFESIATVICHELGHQWSGNLVTMDWWSHTWLNEGFASYFESMACAKIQPDWNLEDKMVPGFYYLAMVMDSYESQAAMSNPANTLDEIEANFGVSSYSKGAAVIRMFRYILTPEVFEKGMKRYFSVNMFKNTKPENLFRAFGAEATKSGLNLLPSGYSFADVARTWTEQPGMPLVTVKADGGVLRLSQERYFDSAPRNESLLQQAWFIPVSIVDEANPNWEATEPQTWLIPGEDTATVTRAGNSNQWFVVNPKQTGYYRVQYDESNWRLLAAAMGSRPSDFPAATRAQLVIDSIVLASAGKLPYANALSFLKALHAERDVAPWQAAITAQNQLSNKLARTEAGAAFKNLFVEITADAYDWVGYQVQDSDSHEKRYLRYYMASYACEAGSTKCLADAAQALKAWLADPDSNPLHPDTKDSTLCYGIRGSDADTFHAMKKLWRQNNDDNLASALTCSQDRALLKGLLYDAVSSSYSSDDGVTIITAFLNRAETYPLLFEFIKEKSLAIVNAFQSRLDIQMLRILISSVSSRREFDEVQQWVEDNYARHENYPDLLQALAAADKMLYSWHDKYYDEVAEWLQSNTATPATPTTTEPSGSSSATASVSTAVLVVSWLIAAMHWLQTVQ